MHTYIVNVFSEYGMKGGNQLGVIVDAANLKSDQMGIITRQLNYSETTFVTNTSIDEASFRIFVPSGEIEYAGHPTIGTAYIIERMHRKKNNPRNSIMAHLRGGSVRTYFDDNLDITYMDQLPVEYRGEFKQKKQLLEAIGLTKEDLLFKELPIFSPSSIQFVFIAAEYPEIVRDLSPDMNKLVQLFEGKHYFPYVFSKDGTDTGDLHARMFAPTAGITEDPATGSAQSALVHAMKYMNLLEDKNVIKVEQGYEIDRPSLLYNKIKHVGDDLIVKTGGKCHLAMEGNLFL